jgi:hypothetical protein
VAGKYKEQDTSAFEVMWQHSGDMEVVFAKEHMY